MRFLKISYTFYGILFRLREGNKQVEFLMTHDYRDKRLDDPEVLRLTLGMIEENLNKRMDTER